MAPKCTHSVVIFIIQARDRQIVTYEKLSKKPA